MSETASPEKFAIDHLHMSVQDIREILVEIRDQLSRFSLPQRVLRGEPEILGLDFASKPSHQTMAIVNMDEPLPPELERAMIGIAELWKRSRRIEYLRQAVWDIEAEIERLLRESNMPEQSS